MQILESEEIAVSEFREKIEIVDVPLAGEGIRLLKLGGPDCGFRKSATMSCKIDWRKGKRRVSLGITKAASSELLAVPRRVVSVVAEHVATVVENDIQDDPHPQCMSGLHKALEVLSRAEMGIHVEEVLNTVTVVSIINGDLLEDRTQPDGADPKPFQISQLGLDTGDGCTEETRTRVPPFRSVLPGSNRIAVRRGIEWCRRARADQVTWLSR